MALKHAPGIWILMVFFGLLVFPQMASASAGVGVSPGKIEFNSCSPGASQQIYVINTGTHRSSFQVFTEPDHQSWFGISEKDFALEPGENRKITITLLHPFSGPGELESRIYVSALPESDEAHYATGIRVPARIFFGSSELYISEEASIQSSGESQGILFLVLSVTIPAIALMLLIFSLRRRARIG